MNNVYWRFAQQIIPVNMKIHAVGEKFLHRRVYQTHKRATSHFQIFEGGGAWHLWPPGYATACRQTNLFYLAKTCAKCQVKESRLFLPQVHTQTGLCENTCAKCQVKENHLIFARYTYIGVCLSIFPKAKFSQSFFLPAVPALMGLVVVLCQLDDCFSVNSPGNLCLPYWLQCVPIAHMRIFFFFFIYILCDPLFRRSGIHLFVSLYACIKEVQPSFSTL